MKKNISKNHNKIITLNRKAKFNYNLKDFFEAGIVLCSWEVKSLQEGKVQISESYVFIKENELWIVGAVITPLKGISTYNDIDSSRSRKLLMHKKEIYNLYKYTNRLGYTIVPIKLYWVKRLVKIELAIAKGKKTYDKRMNIKNREWGILKSRELMRQK